MERDEWTKDAIWLLKDLYDAATRDGRYPKPRFETDEELIGEEVDALNALMEHMEKIGHSASRG